VYIVRVGIGNTEAHVIEGYRNAHHLTLTIRPWLSGNTSINNPNEDYISWEANSRTEKINRIHHLLLYDELEQRLLVTPPNF
jgi:hypothetical protein